MKIIERSEKRLVLDDNNDGVAFTMLAVAGLSGVVAIWDAAKGDYFNIIFPIFFVLTFIVIAYLLKVYGGVFHLVVDKVSGKITVNLRDLDILEKKEHKISEVVRIHFGRDNVDNKLYITFSLRNNEKINVPCPLSARGSIYNMYLINSYRKSAKEVANFLQVPLHEEKRGFFSLR